MGEFPRFHDVVDFGQFPFFPRRTIVVMWAVVRVIRDSSDVVIGMAESILSAPLESSIV